MTGSAKRHAQAVFQIALERNEIDKWRSELKTIGDALSDPSLLAILESPKIHLKDKLELVKRCFPGLSPLAINFAYLLVTRQRARLARDIAVHYERLADAHKGIEHAEVITAIPLSEKEREKVANRLSSVIGKKIVLINKVDPGITGGFVARIGDSIIDASVRARLSLLKRNLQELAVTSKA